ncbi:hypothetical protein Micbo1qcDRAFT_177122 [Microdochium bolleyi]|uniref:BTB domain-containing protein n=1 Tax=Microdochium bolleyi TaxID=196109 RepID=A0A136IY97_9PEZI|nr:hypothetical protein Micbo1qcDRAFT_177122 [Microdochium bolleyi]
MTTPLEITEPRSETTDSALWTRATSTPAESAANPCPSSPSGSDMTLDGPDAQVIVYDARGDLWLRTHGHDALGCSDEGLFLVCSRTLARTSTVFETMLWGGGQAKSRAAAAAATHDPWLAELPEDPTSGMKALLGLMHSSHGDLGSASITRADFVPRVYDLVMLADKYDCLGMLRPWAGAWAQWIPHSIPHGGEENLLRMAWVCYGLGDREGYQAVVSELVVDFEVGFHEDIEEFLPALPPGLLETMDVLRVYLIRSLLAPVILSIAALIRSGDRPVGLCREAGNSLCGEDEPASCEAQMLGRLVVHLHAHGLWPVPEPAAVPHSPGELSLIIARLAAACATGGCARQGESDEDEDVKGNENDWVLHGDCRPFDCPGEQEGSVGALVYRREWVFDAEQLREHFERRAKVTGVAQFSPVRLGDSREVQFPE